MRTEAEATFRKLDPDERARYTADPKSDWRRLRKIFGGLVLGHIEYAQRRYSKELAAGRIEESGEDLKKWWHRLRIMVEPAAQGDKEDERLQEGREAVVIQMVREILADSLVGKDVLLWLQGEGALNGEVVADEQQARAVMKKLFFEGDSLLHKIPAELIYKMTVAHKDAFERRAPEEAQKIKQEFLPQAGSRILAAIESGVFVRAEEQKENLRKRLALFLAGVEIEVMDPVFTLVDGSQGCYIQGISKIIVKEQDSKEAFIDTLTHEIIHAIAGETTAEKIYTVTDEDRGDAKEKTKRLQRGGVSFRANKLNGFNWLNEAMTERMTVQARGADGPHDGYIEERKLLAKILELAQGDQLEQELKDAYFEDYDPKEAVGNRVPQWKKLARSIMVAPSLGNRFLTKVDAYITKKMKENNGWMSLAAKDAVLQLEKHGNDFSKWE